MTVSFEMKSGTISNWRIHRKKGEFMKKGIAFVFLGFCLGFLGMALDEGLAVEAYPSRALTMIVPFPPGGVADLTARPLAAAMEPTLKQPVAVVNKGGAGGLVGIQSAAVSKPDGYTLMVALSSVPYLHEVDTLFNRPKAYTPDHFIPLAMLTADPLVIAVHSDSPWKTVEDFVADAKKRPGALKLGSAGIYSVMHVGAELFFRKVGIQLTHIPYTGRADSERPSGEACGLCRFRAQCHRSPNEGGNRAALGRVGRQASRLHAEHPHRQGEGARRGVLHLVRRLRHQWHPGTRDKGLARRDPRSREEAPICQRDGEGGDPHPVYGSARIQEVSGGR